MKNKYPKTIMAKYLSFFLLALLSGCGGSGCENFDCELDWENMPSQIDAYHTIYNENEKPKINEDINVYIDFSDGLQYVFADNNSRTVFEKFLDRIQTLNDFKPNFFGIDGKKHIIIKERKGDLWTFITNPKNYYKNFARIDYALDSIVQNTKKISVLITDGELYSESNKEQFHRSWAAEAIKKWIKNGNRIELLITDHQDKAIQGNKHLYYMMFIPKGVKENFKKDLITPLSNQQFSELSINKNIYRTKANYSETSGLNEYLELNEDDYTKKDSYEYIEMYVPWSETCENIAQAKNEQTGKPINGGAHILSKLYVEKIDNPFYEIADVSMEVSDIKLDLRDMFCYNKCLKNKENIVFVEDPNSVDKEIDPDNNDCIVLDCFDKKGNINTKNEYKTKGNFEPIKQFLSLNKTLFNSGIESNGKGQIGIKLHKEMMECYFEETGEENLWKISIYVDYKLKEDYSKSLEKLSWYNTKSKETNDALKTSFETAIMDSKPTTKKLIYTYYLKNTL